MEEIQTLKALYKDRLPGGKGDNLSPDDVNQEQLLKGIQIEFEHTKDPLLAMEIAIDHLAEIPNYYDWLEEMEENAKNSEIYPVMESISDDLLLGSDWFHTERDVTVNPVYHGGDDPINEVDLSHAGTRMGTNKNGMYFTTDKDNAEYYGHVVNEAVLHFNNLIVIDDYQQYIEYGKVISQALDSNKIDINDFEMDELSDALLLNPSNMGSIPNILLDSEYDGICVKHIIDGRYPSDVYIIISDDPVVSIKPISDVSLNESDDGVIKLRGRVQPPGVTKMMDYIKDNYQYIPELSRSAHAFSYDEKSYFEIKPFDGKIYVQFIFVMPEARGTGLGNDILNMLMDLANEYGAILALYPKVVGESGLSDAQLRDWYIKNGFTSNNDSTDPDDVDDGTLIYKPDTLTEASGFYPPYYSPRKSEELSDREKLIFAIISMFKAMSPNNKKQFLRWVPIVAKWKLDEYDDNFLIKLKMNAEDIRDSEKDLIASEKRQAKAQRVSKRLAKQMSDAEDWQKEQSRKEREEHAKNVEFWKATGMMDEDGNFIND